MACETAGSPRRTTKGWANREGHDDSGQAAAGPTRSYRVIRSSEGKYAAPRFATEPEARSYAAQLRVEDPPVPQPVDLHPASSKLDCARPGVPERRGKLGPCWPSGSPPMWPMLWQPR